MLGQINNFLYINNNNLSKFEKIFSMKKIYFLVCFFGLFSHAQTKILFDNTKAETAGNADWVIDADTHNLGFSGGAPTSGGGSEANAQKIPTPLQTTIATSTVENYWNGGLSSWAIDCVKAGYVVESLPYNGLITYGQTSNLQDLSHYKVFVIDEPNILFTDSEKTAILTFVKNGGGLCMISDHDISDRNNDGADSPTIWNDLMGNNLVQTNPFGIVFDLTDFSQTTSNIAVLPTNSILHGTAGNVSQAKWSNGTSMTLNSTINPSVKGLIFKTSSSNTGVSNVMCASSTFFAGKIVAIGDSSIADDGSGDSNDTLYDGYIADANGNHQKLLMNSLIWLATSSALQTNDYDVFPDIKMEQNPICNKNLKLVFNNDNESKTIIQIFDNLGRNILQSNVFYAEKGVFTKNIALDNAATGVYFCKISNENNFKTIKFIIP